MYLISSKSILTSDMGTMYQWIREPGYPLFIKLFSGENLNYHSLIYAQSLVTGVSVILAFIYFYNNSRKNFKNALVYFTAGATSFCLVYGYSTWILQQFFFVFLTSIHLIYVWYFDKRESKTIIFVFFSSIIVLLSSLWSIILLPASIFTVMFSFFKYRKNSQNVSIKKLSTSLLALVIIFVPASAFTISWNLFKLSESTSVERLYSDPITISEYGQTSLQDIAYQGPARLGGIMGITNEVLPESGIRPPAASHFYFAFNSIHGGLSCGVFGGGLQEVVNYLELNVKEIMECERSKVMETFYKFTKSVESFFPIIIGTAFILLLIFWFKFNSNVIGATIFPIFAVLPYVLEPYGISRYGLPLIFISPFLIGMLLVSKLDRIQGSFK